MDIYISKNCPHCKKLLLIFFNNKHLIQYFNIMDIETNPFPDIITSVPTLIYNGEAYFDEKMHAIIDDVNQHHIRENSPPQQQPSGQQPAGHQQQMTKGKGKPGPPQGTQQQGMNMGARDPNLNQKGKGNPSPPKGNGPLNDDINEGIMGICSGEDCLYENISDDKGFNNINQAYCFLDDNMDDMNKEKTKLEVNKSENNTSRFDNSAYEEMMKSRSM